MGPSPIHGGSAEEIVFGRRHPNCQLNAPRPPRLLTCRLTGRILRLHDLGRLRQMHLPIVATAEPIGHSHISAAVTRLNSGKKSREAPEVFLLPTRGGMIVTLSALKVHAQEQFSR